MKKLYKKLAVSALVTLIALTVGMAVVIFLINYNAMTATLRQMLLQAEDGYYTAWQENEDSAARQEADFLNRATMVSYMLHRDSSLQTDEGLEELREKMEVMSICLFDENGDVLATSNESRRGGHVDPGTRLEAYMNDPYAPYYEIYWRPSEEGSESRCCSVAMKPRNEAFQTLLVVMDQGVRKILTSDAIMSGTLDNMLTEYNTTVFAISNLTNQVVGITANNPQELRARDVWGNEVDLLARVRALNKGVGCLRLDSGDAIVTAMEFGDYTLVGFSSMSILAAGVLLPLLAMLGVTLAFGALLFYRTNYYWKRYLLLDLHNLESDIYRVLGGDFQVEARCTNNEDLNSLAEAFNALKEGYEHREERLSRIATSLGGGVAIFDCVEQSGLTFFSSNMREILGMTREEWVGLRDDYAAFSALVERLAGERDENGIVRFHNRHLDIRLTRDKNGINGIIIDASAEVARRNQLMSELNRAEIAVRRDGMTGLLNRTGFEQEVIRCMGAEEPVGVMLMMDMDNFKNVNDSLGHPEGDRLLCLVGDSLRRIFRRSDVVAHFGGDEFAVFLPSSLGLDELEGKLKELQDRLRADMRAYERYGTSMSVGAAFVRNGDYADLYQRADSALYIAKRMGKDCYYINTEDISCMRVECVACREHCPRRDVLGLNVTGDQQ